MVILLCSLGLLLCFYLLFVICDDYFVLSLEKLSEKMKLSSDVAGATLMAMGSSAPELFTSLVAITKIGSENIGAGTIVGSAIFNVLVIVGVSAFVATAILSWKSVLRDLLFYLAAVIILLVTFYDGQISMTDAIIYLVFYGIYIIVLAFWNHMVPSEPEEKTAIDEVAEEMRSESGGFFSMITRNLDKCFEKLFPNPDRYVLVFLLSIFYIGALSWGLVELAIVLAHELAVSEVIIALTVLAAGTSVPDMFSSIIVARKGKGDMAVSNAVGSNTFDILVGLGLPWILYIAFTGKQLAVSPENLLSSVILLFSTVAALLVLLIVQRFKIGRWTGLLLLLLYAGYLFYAIQNAQTPDAWGIEAWAKSFF